MRRLVTQRLAFGYDALNILMASNTLQASCVANRLKGCEMKSLNDVQRI